MDIEASAAAILEAEAAMESGDHTLAAERAREALSTDLQTFLPDAEGGWAAEQRRELETIRLRALETLAEAGLRQGGRELGAAEQAARAAIAAAPFRESSHRLLMEVHEAAGNPAEALRAFEELRSLLREELGTTPGPAAMTVFERVLRGEPPPVHRSLRAVPASAGVPWEASSWPAPLGSAVDRHALVGRGVELAYLDRCWREAGEGQRALVLLTGDAGIGKTRTAAELAAHAHGEGAVVLYGRFDEETLTPYQPVVEMLRGWSAGAPLDSLRERLGPRAAELSILLPEFGPPPADHMTPGAITGPEADAQRYRFFDAVAALIGEVGAEVAGDAGLRRPAVGGSPDAAAPAPSRALARAAARAVRRHLPRERDHRPPPAARAGRRPAPRGHAAPARAHRPGRGGGGRAGGRAGVGAGDRVVRARARRRDGGQPVLHRGGRAPHPRHRGRADRGGDARGGGRARRRARGHRAAAAAA